MIERNLLLVVNIAKRYVGRGLELMDLTAEGSLGLIHAIERFGLGKRVRYSTYAFWWVRENIESDMMFHDYPIRLQRKYHDTYETPISRSVHFIESQIR